MSQHPTIHATAVLAGALGILIRGPSGSGKSSLARDILCEPQRFGVSFGCLVADDRVFLRPCNGRLLARAPENLRGLLEQRGFGITQWGYEQEAVIDLVVDLESPIAQRIPSNEGFSLELEGLKLPHLAIGAGISPVALLHATIARMRNL